MIKGMCCYIKPSPWHHSIVWHTCSLNSMKYILYNHYIRFFFNHVSQSVLCLVVYFLDFWLCFGLISLETSNADLHDFCWPPFIWRKNYKIPPLSTTTHSSIPLNFKLKKVKTTKKMLEAKYTFHWLVWETHEFKYSRVFLLVKNYPKIKIKIWELWKKWKHLSKLSILSPPIELSHWPSTQNTPKIH